MPHKNKETKAELITIDVIERKIYLVRQQKVMLDSDLAELYSVETKMLNRAVKRNLERFPEDFMFLLTEVEYESLRFQIGTSKGKHGGRRYMPYVFTEQGVAMLSGVLNSERAIQVNIAIMRAFVDMRRLLSTNEEVNRKLAAIESKIGVHDEHFKRIFTAIRLLMEPPGQPEKKIGYIQGPKGKNAR